MTYRKNDIIRFMTKRPQVHLMEMFGHCEFNPEEIVSEEYVGRVNTVIEGGKSYLITTIRPLNGFICIEDAEAVLGKMETDQLTLEEREKCEE